MKRRKFVQSAVWILASGKVLSGSAAFASTSSRKTVLRFAVASDGHYGENNTNYKEFYETIISKVNAVHKADPFSFFVVNGDIVHDDKTRYPEVKALLDQLQPKYYVTQGNHDHVTADEWQRIWNMPVNHDFSIADNSILLCTSSNEKGEYTCPDVKWIADKLEQYKTQRNIFMFIHINPGKLTKNGVECPELFELFSKYKNVRVVFNGHDHDEDGIKFRQEMPFIFDAHLGGSWGTAYRGFRIVELMDDNSIVTYIMNPGSKINEAKL